MAFVVCKVDGGYGYSATPPDSQFPEADSGPLTLKQLIAVGNRLGVHVQDFWYAVQVADPDALPHTRY